MGAPCAAPEEEYGAREGGGEAGTKAAGKTFAAVRAHLEQVTKMREDAHGQ